MYFQVFRSQIESLIQHGSAARCNFHMDSGSLEQQTYSLEICHSITDRFSHQHYLYHNYVLEFDTSIGHLVIDEDETLLCWMLEDVLNRSGQQAMKT
jgi:hypothetical protein